jgi:hypothetical protein
VCNIVLSLLHQKAFPLTKLEAWNYNGTSRKMPSTENVTFFSRLHITYILHSSVDPSDRTARALTWPSKQFSFGNLPTFPWQQMTFMFHKSLDNPLLQGFSNELQYYGLLQKGDSSLKYTPHSLRIGACIMLHTHTRTQRVPNLECP